MKAKKISSPLGLEIFLYFTIADRELRLNRDSGSCENRASPPIFFSHKAPPTHGAQRARCVSFFPNSHLFLQKRIKKQR